LAKRITRITRSDGTSEKIVTTKQTTRITRSDGTSENIVTTKKGCLYYLGIVLLFSFVLAETLRYWYIDVPIIGALLVIGIVRMLVKRKKRGPECPDCHGYGYPIGRKGEDCKRCHGNGYLGVDVPISQPQAVPVPQPQAVPVPQPQVVTVPEARFEFADYDGGLLQHPQPEATGTLILPGPGSTIGRWELHFATGKDLIPEHRLTHGGFTAAPLAFEATGPSSCRGTIRDLTHPAVLGHFHLPNTPIAEVEAALAARATVVEASRNAPGWSLATDGQWHPPERHANYVAPPPAPKPAVGRVASAPSTSVADELAKLLDLKNAGALTDDEFAAQKAKLLGS